MEIGERSLPYLSEQLIEQIVFAMEDQVTEHFIDTEKKELTTKELIDPNEFEMNPDRYIPIPDWTPADGFRTMRDFVSDLQNELYKEQLWEALHSGKGVFRKFKDIVQTSTALEKMWYDYKEGELRRTLYKWYGIEQEASKYSHLSEGELETSSHNILKEDFLIFSDPTNYITEITELKEEFLEEQRQQSNNYHNIELIQKMSEQSRDDHYLLLATSEDDLVGWLTYRIGNKEEAHITYYYIKEEFRGLSLMRFLIEMLELTLQEKHISHIVVEMPQQALCIESIFDSTHSETLTKTVRYTLT